MEIITDLMSVWFGLLLAALAVAPNLIGVYLERHRQKRRDAQRPTSKMLGAYPSPVPFNYPPLVLRELPGKPDGQGIQDAGQEDPADWWKGQRRDNA